MKPAYEIYSSYVCEKRSNISTKNEFKISRRGNPLVDKKFYGLKMFRIKRLSSIIVNHLFCMLYTVYL